MEGNQVQRESFGIYALKGSIQFKLSKEASDHTQENINSTTSKSYQIHHTQLSPSPDPRLRLRYNRGHLHPVYPRLGLRYSRGHLNPVYPRYLAGDSTY